MAEERKYPPNPKHRTKIRISAETLVELLSLRNRLAGVKQSIYEQNEINEQTNGDV